MSTEKDLKKTVFIGAGNVAGHLSQAMKAAGYEVVQIFSRTGERARRLGKLLSCDSTADMAEIRPDADIYIFSVNDDALPGLAARIPAGDGLRLHTAGSVPISVFRGYAARYGAVYPLQTFSEERRVNFCEVPLFVEGNSEATEEEIMRIAGRLSANVRPLSSDKRAYLHLAAVFACNFTNHMYRIAADILEERGIDPRVLQALIDETAGKLHDMPPASAQTGPAVRRDSGIISRQQDLIADPAIRLLYTMISKSIYEHAKQF